MLNLAFLAGILGLPVAGLLLTPTSQTFARIGTSLAMACLLLWLLVFWSTTITMAWPLLSRTLATWPF